MRSSTGDGPRHQWCEHELHCPPVSDAAMPGPSHLGGHIPASLLLPTALSLSLTRGITDFGLSRERLMQLAPCRRCRTPGPTKGRGRAAAMSADVRVGLVSLGDRVRTASRVDSEPRR